MFAFGLLGVFWARLGVFWRRLGGVLRRLGRVLGRFKRKKLWRVARVGALLWVGSTLSFRDEERLHACRLPINLYRPLQTRFQRTQTRSWAPSGPKRIQLEAKLRPPYRAKIDILEG